MKKSCHFGILAAAALVAATALTTGASANPFGWFGQPLFGYGPPTDNGNQVRADLRRRVVDLRTMETPHRVIHVASRPAPRS